MLRGVEGGRGGIVDVVKELELNDLASKIGDRGHEGLEADSMVRKGLKAAPSIANADNVAEDLESVNRLVFISMSALRAAEL